MRGERASMLKACALVGGLLVVGCGSSSSGSAVNSGGGGGGGGGTVGIGLGTGGTGGSGTGGTTGGTGGTTGGTGGGTGTGGVGGSGSTKPECQFPSCFDMLNMPSAECTPMGACVKQTVQPNINICWANGVKEKIMIALDGTGNAVATAQVTSTSGASCFSFEFMIDAATGSIEAVTFRDAAGKTIGTLSLNPDDSVTATCLGQAPKTLPASCGMDMNTMMPGMMPGDTMCTDGVCM